jgi:hypothetical protein
MKRKTIILSFAFLVILGTACNTHRFSVVGKQKLQIEQLIDSVDSNAINYQHLALKFSAKIENQEDNYSFSGNIRICNDSIIWISVQKMNIEAVRILIRPDSAFIIDRMEKTITRGSVDSFFVNTYPDLDYPFFVSLLTNNLYLMSDKITDSFTNYTSCKDKTYYCLQNQFTSKSGMQNAEDGSSLLEKGVHQIKISPQTFHIAEVLLNTNNGDNILECKYDDFKTFDGVLFPSTIWVTVNMFNNISSLQLNIQRINIRDEQMYPFNMPEKYRILDF